MRRGTGLLACDSRIVMETSSLTAWLPVPCKHRRSNDRTMHSPYSMLSASPNAVRFLHVLAFLLAGAFPAPAAARNTDPENLHSGLLGQYRTAEGRLACVRVDHVLMFDWSDGGAPDPRLLPGPFSVLWQGFLFVETSGLYEFHVHTGGGSFQLWIDGRPVLQATAQAPGWFRTAPIRLKGGLRELEVLFRSDGGGIVKLCWESERFVLEPIGARHLFHQRTQEREPDELYQRGARLTRVLRCSACHVIPGDAPPLPAPALDHSLRGVSHTWLKHWLLDPASVQPAAKMPAFGLTEDEASLLTDFLLSRAPEEQRNAGGGNLKRGRELFVLRGCAACHVAEGTGNAPLFGGGHLDNVGWKRAPGSLARLLSDPGKFNPDARMPKPALTDRERADLVAYLSTLKQNAPREGQSRPGQIGDLALASRLIEELRCAACHRIEGFGPPPRIELDPRRLSATGGCLGEPGPDSTRPGYRLPPEDRNAVLHYLRSTHVEEFSQLTSVERGRQQLEERNCTACHRRGRDEGYVAGLRTDRLQKLGLSESFRRGELAPPAIDSVGDKFTEGYLSAAIQGLQNPRRPWLEVHMPEFRMPAADREALLAYFLSEDRVPAPLPDSRLRAIVDVTETLAPGDALLAARRLVSSQGLGCMSCHTMKGRQPRGAEPEARGPELVGIGNILRAPWFMRWVRDPTRIALGVEMPAVQVAVPGVLGGDLNRQLAALWVALASEQFEPPDDASVIVQTISPRAEGKVVVLRDCIRNAPVGSGWCPRSFAMGFPDGMNVLIDLDTYTVRSIWVGDLAHEKTEGKTWLWEPAGQQAFARAPALPSLVLSGPGGWVAPERRWQSVGRLLWWEHVDNTTVRFAYRLWFEPGAVTVTETWSSPASPEKSGAALKRVIEVQAPSEFHPFLVADLPGRWSVAGPRLDFESPLGPMELAATADWKEARLTNNSVPVLPLARSDGSSYSAELSYRIAGLDPESLDITPVQPRPEPAASAAVLPWVPGYRTIRFPLPKNVLPVSIAFLTDDTPIVGSLRGGIYMATDSDKDGLYDGWRRYSDYLAAPFGLLVEPDGIVVSHKPELVRLVDRDRDGFAERTEVIATGWGYTHDYHDWTFGVVKDRRDRYVVTLGSDYQQKGRPREASRYRGHALAIARDGSIEDIARGLRFPVGIAANSEGEIFFTDNQGVQNTFNELNHLVPFSRYGVPALYDPPPEKDPWPERYPAIQIPHPWTRSVNGICFLSHQAFGPPSRPRCRLRVRYAPADPVHPLPGRRRVPWGMLPPQS